MDQPNAMPARPAAAGPSWRALPIAAKLYVAAVIAAGAVVLLAFAPRHIANPTTAAVLFALACVTSVWKVNLPISIANGSTLSVSYAANLAALLLLGTNEAIVIAVAGAFVQCTYKARRRYPSHRTLFSSAAAAITMAMTGAVYVWVGGPFDPVHSMIGPKPLVATIGTYFITNTVLIAAAIALSTGSGILKTWYREFLWSGASFMVAGTAGALAAVVIARGDQWKAILLIAPIYLTYRTYEVFVGRLEDQKRHMSEMRRLHEQTVLALDKARDAERREQIARASAEQANRVKDEFLAMVSHELRTPLNAILGWADMLHRRTLDRPMHDRAVAAIHSSAKRQAELIDDLLDVSRIVSGKLRLDRVVVDMANAVRDAVQVVQPAADARGVKLIVNAESGRTCVYADAARLQQIVWNLLSNAVKFTPSGGTVTVTLASHGAEAELVVSDTGQGIAPEFLPSIFEPFRQADGSTTRAHRGLGLGLSIVKSLVEAHGGHIEGSSAGAGRGATFVVRLPSVGARRSVAPAMSRDHAGAVKAAPASLDGLAVLVVDDDADCREVVAAHLEECRASVLTASSAAEALDVLAHRHVDVLLADIGMPEEDGYALIRKIRKSTLKGVAAVPAAALTAFARDEDRLQALDAGFQLHIAKPVDPPSLVSAVASLGRPS